MTSTHIDFHSDSMNSYGDFSSVEDMNKNNFQSKDPIISLPTPKKPPMKKTSVIGVYVEHPTSYAETLMHLLKGNLGTGIFAMGDAMKNAGILLGPPVMLFLGILSVYCQHLLLKAAKDLRLASEIPSSPDYAETVELVFAKGSARLQRMSKFMKCLVNVFLCTTQMGYCCVYIVFIAENLHMVLEANGFIVNVNVLMVIIFIPILLPCLVRNLKYLTPFSTIANVFMAIGLLITIYYCVQGLPSISERRYVASIDTMPLFFGTAMFAFEGIGLVLPLQNEMKKPEDFRKPFGVVNVGMAIVITLYLVMGSLSYLKYEDVEGSVTLNFPSDEFLAQLVKIIISTGILLTYSLQLYIPVEVMWPHVHQYIGDIKHPVVAELVFRTSLVILTFVLAEVIPYLQLFISLVGAISGAPLILIFPSILHLVSSYGSGKLTVTQICTDVAILILGIVGAITGTYTSIQSIVETIGSG